MSTRADSKQDQIYETVRARLSDGIYPPGHRVKVAQLSRELGVSNIPVREALRRLEAEGWLEYAPNVGMRVASRDPQAWVDLMTPFAVLAGYATAEAAAALRADGGLADLRKLNAHMLASLQADDYEAATTANAAFHQRIFDSVPNPELRRSLSETWERLNLMRRAIYGSIPVRAFQSVAEHDELLDLLERGADHFAIEAAARAHTLRTVAASRTAAARSEVQP
jgi:DNA-binding GntR family transcriptional regulator